MFVFRKIWRVLFSCNQFWDLPFHLITGERANLKTVGTGKQSTLYFSIAYNRNSSAKLSFTFFFARKNSCQIDEPWSYKIMKSFSLDFIELFSILTHLMPPPPPQKKKKNQKIKGLVFRGFRKRPTAWNGLIRG